MRGAISGSEMPQCDAGELLAEGERARRRPPARRRPGRRPATARGLDGVGEPAPQPFLHHQAVDDDAMSCLNFLSRSMVLLELAHLAVDLDPGEAVGRSCSKSLPYSPLRPRTTGARTLKRVSGSSSQTWSTICCTLCPRDGPPAVGAVRVADARVQQAQVVVDLGDRADRGARVARGRLLVDGDGRREALDGVDVRLVHLAEELARVGREALDVAALALGVDRVEGERRLAGAGQAGDDDEACRAGARADVLEVVLARAGDDRGRWSCSHCRCPCQNLE